MKREKFNLFLDDKLIDSSSSFNNAGGDKVIKYLRSLGGKFQRISGTIEKDQYGYGVSGTRTWEDSNGKRYIFEIKKE
jgi:hypothetical protein